MRFCTFALTGLVEEALGTNQKPFLGLVWFVGWLVGLSVGLSVFRQNPIGDGAGGEILHFCFHRIGRGSTRNQSEAFLFFFQCRRNKLVGASRTGRQSSSVDKTRYNLKKKSKKKAKTKIPKTQNGNRNNRGSIQCRRGKDFGSLFSVGSDRFHFNHRHATLPVVENIDEKKQKQKAIVSSFSMPVRHVD